LAKSSHEATAGRSGHFTGLSYSEAARIMRAVGATAEKSVALFHAQGSAVVAMTMEYQ
jgi:hypothetical protein